HAILLLAHGAGAGQGHPFMTGLARALTTVDVDVVTFDFPYTHAGRKLPDKQPVLEACFERVLEWTRHRAASRGRARLFIGGKSMGGRMATHIGGRARAPLHGVIALGYPLRPPGGAGKDRTSHLAALRVPFLVVQGTRDSFGTPDDIRTAVAHVSTAVTIVPVEGGDHSFAVRGRPPAEVLASVAAAVAGWMRSLDGD